MLSPLHVHYLGSQPFVTSDRSKDATEAKITTLQARTSADHAAVVRFRAALAAKDEVEAHLESELAAARAQAASYEHR